MESDKISMCNSAVHRPFSQIVDPFPISTFQFLRTCNRFVLPTEIGSYYTVMKDKQYENIAINNIKSTPLASHRPLDKIPTSTDASIIFPASTTIPYRKDTSSNSLQLPLLTSSTSPCSPEHIDYSNPSSDPSMPSQLPSLSYSSLFSRRQRGEKRPIPDEQKDDKYFERRKRNNEAAKKSRDARKLREDRIAFRAAILEHENALLRAQLLSLRDEMLTLRQMIGPRVPISVGL